jgi:hypothetical protein
VVGSNEPPGCGSGEAHPGSLDDFVGAGEQQLR